MARIRIEHDHYNDTYLSNRQNGPEQWYVGFTLAGEGSVAVQEQDFICLKGHFILIPPNVPFRVRTAGRYWQTVACVFMPRESWDNWPTLASMDKAVLLSTKDRPLLHDGIYSAFVRMIRYANDSRLCRKDDLALNALEEIFLLLPPVIHSDKPVDPRIRELLSWVEQHYAEPLLLENLAQKVCLSPSRLSHLFKEQVGESIIERLTKIRLRRAEKRLLYTTASVTEIAIESGFNSPEHFTRQFSKYYQMSPIRYRQSH